MGMHAFRGWWNHCRGWWFTGQLRCAQERLLYWHCRLVEHDTSPLLGLGQISTAVEHYERDVTRFACRLGKDPHTEIARVRGR